MGYKKPLKGSEHEYEGFFFLWSALMDLPNVAKAQAYPPSYIVTWPDAEWTKPVKGHKEAPSVIQVDLVGFSYGTADAVMELREFHDFQTSVKDSHKYPDATTTLLDINRETVKGTGDMAGVVVHDIYHLPFTPSSGSREDEYTTRGLLDRPMELGAWFGPRVVQGMALTARTQRIAGNNLRIPELSWASRVLGIRSGKASPNSAAGTFGERISAVQLFAPGFRIVNTGENITRAFAPELEHLDLPGNPDVINAVTSFIKTGKAQIGGELKAD